MTAQTRAKRPWTQWSAGPCTQVTAQGTMLPEQHVTPGRKAPHSSEDNSPSRASHAQRAFHSQLCVIANQITAPTDCPACGSLEGRCRYGEPKPPQPGRPAVVLTIPASKSGLASRLPHASSRTPGLNSTPSLRTLVMPLNHQPRAYRVLRKKHTTYQLCLTRQIVP